MAGYPNQAMDINFNVTIYRNHTVGAGPQPRDNAGGGIICSYTGLPGTYSASGVSGAQWDINLPTTCPINDTSINRHRWVAVQADLDQSLGQWYWATQTTADRPIGADWRDTFNLFSLGCVSFRKVPTGGDIGRSKLMQDCIFGGDAGQPDFILILD